MSGGGSKENDHGLTLCLLGLERTAPWELGSALVNAGPLPVAALGAETRIEGSRIYVLPETCYLEISDGDVRLANSRMVSPRTALEASHEELQSANEELEASWEELQVLNEELSGVNVQLEEKIRELEHANNDLNNLLLSTDIATIFLDPALRLRRFTPATVRLVRLSPGDLGQELARVAPGLADAGLLEDCRVALESAQVVAEEVTREDGRAFLRRVGPYRLADGGLGGVVITFSDVSVLRQQARQIAARERQHAAIAELGRKALGDIAIEALCQEAAELSSSVLDVPLAKVLRLDEDGKNLLLLAGVGWEEGAVGTSRIGAESGSQASFTLVSKGPVIVRSLKEETRFCGPQLLSSHGVVSGMSVVIGTEKEPWGVFGIHTREERVFTQDDVNFLQAVAHVIYERVRRHRVVRELEESRRRYRLVADAMPVLLALCDADGRYVFCNAAYREWFGVEPEALIGRKVREVTGEDAYARVEPHIRRVMAGKRVSYRGSLPYRSGGARDVEVNFIPDVRDGEVAGYFAMIQDVSESLKAERMMVEAKEILESEVDARTEELRVLSDNVPALFAYVDPDLRYRFLNRLYEEEFQMKPGEFVGREVKDAFGPDNFVEIEPHLRAALRGEEQHFEISVDLPRDGIRAYRAHYVPHFDAHGGVQGIFVLADDVTRLRRLQKDVLEAAEREKERIGRELHDSLCQELSGVGMLGQALSRKLSLSDSPFAGEVESLVGRINRITHQSREIARGLCPVTLQERGLAQALADYCELVPDLFGGVMCDFVDHLNGPEPGEPVATQLFIIAREAVFNAARHANAEVITVELSSQSHRVVLRVWDDGDGRPDALKEGLGLRSMRYRAQTLGGRLVIGKSPAGRGIQVVCTIRLPGVPEPRS